MTEDRFPCDKGHERSKGITTFRSAMKAAEGDESRVEPCFQCEKYFVRTAV